MLLNCHTYYSFGYGTLSTEALLQEVVDKQYSAFALTDINNTSAVIDTIRMAKEKSIHAAIGIDFRNGVHQQYIGLAINNQGFHELNSHLSKHLHHNTPFDAIAPDFQHVWIIYPFKNYQGQTLKENEFIGIASYELNKLLFSKIPKNKLVVLQPLSFLNKVQHNAHRLLRAIDLNTLLSKLPKTEEASIQEMAFPQSTLKEAFAEYPEIIDRTMFLLQSCKVDFEYGKFANKNRQFYTDSLSEDMALLRRACMQGLAYRYQNPGPMVLERMEKELAIIEQMKFASYFLINWDIVQYAQHKDYFYIGRGSGANSLVAYLTRITDVDPIDLDLYFERFINPFRTNPPDFDIDFSWTDRDDITDYIFKRFGNEKTALLGAYNTFQHDAVIRELGKIFGLPAPEIDKLQSLKSLQGVDDISKWVMQYSRILHGFPSHLSIHSSGILISEAPITSYSATFMPPKGYPTAQFSMLEAEDIGLYKFDILSQRGLGKIKDAVSIIKENKGVDIDIHDIPKFKQDETIKQNLAVGKCIGCFYVESPAMRMLLAKLQADDYLRLVAASSIIRPGVSKSGMMRAYILRYRDTREREKAKQALPDLYKILEETYGVMVYQEDVIKVAHQFAGLTLAEADHLRRGMSWKFKQRNEFHKIRETFFNNCLQRGYDLKNIENIWIQIESFANYAFSKGHSASYAVESYQALYLKVHYPLEYMVATINNGGGFYKTEFYVHEARMYDATILAPCVNHSEGQTIIQGSAIYLGFSMIAQIEHHTWQRILQERAHAGPYADLYDFLRRVPISLEQLRLLIRVGAFAFTGQGKKDLLWKAHQLIHPLTPANFSQELFEVKPKEFVLPTLDHSWLDDAYDEKELLGFALCNPFLLARNRPDGTLLSKDFKTSLYKEVSVLGYLVTVKKTITGKREVMAFGTFLDEEGRWVDTVHFPPSLKLFPFRGPGIYQLHGRLTEEFDFISLEVTEMKRLETLGRER
jgi:DNA polymerase-3 subunit alpha